MSEAPDVLFDALDTVPDLEDAFSDASILTAMLRFELALARAEARAGLIPETVAAAIATVEAADLDPRALARQARASATPAIPFVEALVAAVAASAPDAAAFVHRGATSQDVTDTALVLCLTTARHSIDRYHARLASALRRISDEHATTITLARTLLQPAGPTTFGLKAAGWLGSLSRSHVTLTRAFDDACVLQFGGASGTLAALGNDGLGVAEEVARELGLRLPPAPWHAHRDRLATLVAACGIYAGAIAKTAGDIALLMQAEVAEVSEPGGGSSALPHKRNPAGCAVAIASASRLPGLVATFLAGMAQEHERGLLNGSADSGVVAAAVSAAGSAASALAGVVESLRIDGGRMRRAIDETGGAIFAERAMIRLAPVLGREAAAKAIQRALETRAPGRSFTAALFANPDAAGAIPAVDRATFDDPTEYLGAADAFRRRLIDETCE